MYSFSSLIATLNNLQACPLIAKEDREIIPGLISPSGKIKEQLEELKQKDPLAYEHGLQEFITVQQNKLADALVERDEQNNFTSNARALQECFGPLRAEDYNDNQLTPITFTYQCGCKHERTLETKHFEASKALLLPKYANTRCPDGKGPECAPQKCKGNIIEGGRSVPACKCVLTRHG